jgi:uncharacterized protein YbbC (DUF1343 family)
MLEDDLHSFVGLVDAPLRHGLTAGEFCLYGAWRLGLISESEAIQVAERSRKNNRGDDWLQIIPLKGWRRSLYFDEIDLPWTMPSPNMPTLDTAVTYPGQVLLEGTNLSEGRGTTRPFEIFGAPYVNRDAVRDALCDLGTSLDADSAVVLRDAAFEPTFQKHEGVRCQGFQIHVRDRELFRPVSLTTAILLAMRKVHPKAFAWRDPPYEYDEERQPKGWDPDLTAYRKRVEPMLLYEE